MFIKYSCVCTIKEHFVISIFRQIYARWQAPIPIVAPTFPANYIPGMVQTAQPVVMVNPGNTVQAVQRNYVQQQMVQQRVGATQQQANQNVILGQVVVTQATVVQQAAPIQTPQTTAQG